MEIPELRFSRCRRCLRQEASFNGRLPLQRLGINANPAFFLFSIPFKEHFISSKSRNRGCF